METLIIYDETGTIYFQASGNVAEPVGLQHMMVEVPHGMRVSKIDTNVVPHVPIFEGLPKSQIETEVEQLKAQNQLIQKALDDLILGGGF